MTDHAEVWLDTLAQQYGYIHDPKNRKGYPFRKTALFCLPTGRAVLLVWKFPKPSKIAFTSYYTAQGDFAKVLRKIFKKV